MKPFDLEAAKRGEPIQTRDGRPVKFIAHVPEAEEPLRVIVLTESSPGFRHEDGAVHYSMGNGADLFMSSRKRTMWVNLLHPYAGDLSYGYPAHAFSTKEQADDADRSSSFTRIGNRAWLLEIEE